MKGKILLFLLLVSCSLTHAQIVIKVFDEELKPVQGAVLQSEEPDLNLVSDEKGSFFIDTDKVKQVVITHIAYHPRTLEDLQQGDYTVVLVPKNIALGEVKVEGFANDRAVLSSVAGAIRRIGASELDRFDQQSLVRPINLTPGIRFEERAGSSYRISIRGSALRSPFGIRNVKVYWNGIPFTDPGGNTFLNLLDRQNLNDLEVIKGPAGSMFGAGTGGVMKFKSTNYAQVVNSVRANVNVASFGSYRFGIQGNTTNQKSSWTAKYVHHQTEGYRDHNAMNKHVVELDGLFFPSEKQTMGVSFVYTDLFYQIPGGLNLAQFEDDPEQARPGSEAQNSSIDHQMVLFRLSNEIDLSPVLSNHTSVFGNIRNFENPFILDYKEDQERRLGMRSVFEFKPTSGKLAIIGGVEYQRAALEANNYGNVNGEKDTIRFADELINSDLILFAKANYWFTDSWKLEAGLSLPKTVYNIDRRIDRINNLPQSFKKDFEARPNPRVALSKVFSPQVNAHFSVSTGYSAPTTLEVRTNEGSLNTQLEPERGVNYEFNLRGRLNQFSYDLSLFRFDLTESITSFTNQDGVVLFRNAGSLRQQGVELEILKPWVNDQDSFLSSLSSKLAFTYHDFSFKDYVNGGDDFSGNQLTGTPPLVLGFSTDATIQGGFYVNCSYLYTDSIPLNDENLVYADSYNMLFAKIGWQKELKRTELNLSLGVNNILNESYSLGNDLNAFGGRYYQPAPPRNFNIDLSIRLKK